MNGKITIKTTIRDFLQGEFDMDVCDDYSDDLYIAFCGPAKLTPIGQKRYEDVLDLPVRLYADCAEILLDDREDCEQLERKCKDLFESLAGWCTDKQYRTWFVCD